MRPAGQQTVLNDACKLTWHTALVHRPRSLATQWCRQLSSATTVQPCSARLIGHAVMGCATKAGRAVPTIRATASSCRLKGHSHSSCCVLATTVDPRLAINHTQQSEISADCTCRWQRHGSTSKSSRLNSAAIVQRLQRDMCMNPIVDATALHCLECGRTISNLLSNARHLNRFCLDTLGKLPMCKRNKPCLLASHGPDVP